MDGELRGKTAVVTGGGRGIGRAIAEALARAGAAVGVVARSQEEIAETAARIESDGGRALAVAADATDAGAVAAMAREVEARLGPVDVLVNNAGSLGALGPAWETDPETWWGDIATSLVGAYLCTRSVVPAMVERGDGTVVNVSSYAAIRPSPYMSAYGAAKAALVHFTNTLAAETEEHGVRVFAIAPGTVATAMTEHMQSSPWIDPVPEERFVEPERAGELVVLLASGRADALSGRFLHVLDDVEELAARADEVAREDLYTLRLRSL